MNEIVFKVLCPFGGSGGGALGFLDAEVRLLGHVGRFECMGSIDFDRVACDDFERFTGSPAWCVDVETITSADVRARFGERRPDVVFMSPPCKGSSRLLSKKKARTAKYRRMNRLAVVWTVAMLEAWRDDPPPLVLLENVPGLPHRARPMLRSLRTLLRAAGYVFHASSHDCGEIGGLAQHRERYLLVARRPSACPSLLYQPPKRRVRACGEVLSELPMPATLEARAWGALHTLPRIEWRNWLRLALIPAGGDWRDLPGVLAEEQARREVHRRHAVQPWDEPAPAVTGPGGHSVGAIADPRIADLEMNDRPWGGGTLGVLPLDEPTGTIAGQTNPSNGRFSVADDRVRQLEITCEERAGGHGVTRWGDASKTVTGASKIDNRPVSIADPRLAALEVPTAYDAGYGVLSMNAPARTVAGRVAAGTGAYAVADGRARRTLDHELPVRLLSLDEALDLDLPATKPPPFVPVIVARDGTWHRPLTLLELAALQSYPREIRGQRLHFGGTRTVVAEHIGNSVPPLAARAIGERMLVVLIEGALGVMSLSSGAVWVEPARVEAATA